jgi:hypothetical protein
VYVELLQQESTTVLAPGQFVQGTVTSGKEQNRWVVPRRAIDRQRLMLIEDGRVRSVPADADFMLEGNLPSLGLPDRQWAVLAQSLPQRALVVVDSSRTLAEGTPAIPVIAADATARAGRPEQDDVEGSPQ